MNKDFGYKPSVWKKAKFQYFPLDMTLNKAIKLADNAKKTSKYNSGLRYGSCSFVEFKRDPEKFKKITSIESKYEEINRFSESLNKSKNLL